ncbi:hypothetical protein VKT23_008956 [Stygiomarasmius scandens]|uniref:Uncharacterized protein n=1 Tax=Marasmiellus scandens TaxID=2682957 RepID=A0ABR1JIU5_9AGAR
MGAKRKRVPAALHSELTEYSSLIRALRTSNTLDVTSQLARYQEESRNVDTTDDDHTDVDEDLTDEEDYQPRRTSVSASMIDGPVAGPSNYQDLPTPDPSQTLGKRKRHTSTASTSPQPTSPSVSSTRPKVQQKKRRRDTWTRWPLLLEDVPVPEWNLADEVAIIVKQVLKAQLPSSPTSSIGTAPTSSPAVAPPTSSPAPISPSPPSPDHHSGDDDEDENIDSDLDFESETDDEAPSYLSALTHSTERYLYHVLSSIAAIIPARTASMQNRIKPIDWETVLEALIACGTVQGGDDGTDTNTADTGVSAKVLNRVRERMEAIYGPAKKAGSRSPTETDPTQLQVSYSDNNGTVRVISPSRRHQQPQDGPSGSSAFAEPYPTPLPSQQAPSTPSPAPSRRLPISRSTSRTPLSRSQSQSRSPPLSPSSLTTHRIAAFVASKQRLADALAKYGATEDSLHPAEEEVQLDRKAINSLLKKRARRKGKEKASDGGNEIEQEVDQQSEEGGEANEYQAENISTRSQPKRKAKSVGEASLALTAKTKKKPRGKPFTGKKAKTQEQKEGDQQEEEQEPGPEQASKSRSKKLKAPQGKYIPVNV